MASAAALDFQKYLETNSPTGGSYPFERFNLQLIREVTRARFDQRVIEP
jgi:hypothetical protein